MKGSLWSVAFERGEASQGAGVLALLDDGTLIGGDRRYSYVGRHRRQDTQLTLTFAAVHHQGPHYPVLGAGDRIPIEVTGAADDAHERVLTAAGEEPPLTVHLFHRLDLP